MLDLHAGARASLRACAVVLLATFLLVACGRTKPVLPPTYTVKSGDTLYSIAWRHDLDYQQLARWNRLPADFRIYPGQVLRLHGPAGQRSVPAAKSRTAPSTRPAAKKAPTPQPLQIPAKDRVASWVWPTEVAASHVHSTNAPALIMMGSEGQAVRAAAPGKVVYTGSGVRGFGELIIIKHTEVFLSAYAHNRVLKVKEGDDVTRGQSIAEMGLGAKQQPMLYFEIRINGQPVDPLQYLPRR